MKIPLTIMFLFMFSMNLIMSTNSNISSSKMIFSLIMMILIMCIYTYKIMKNSWFSLSLYLVMIGGMIILFSLIASISPKTIPNSTQMSNLLTFMFFPTMYSMVEGKSLYSNPPMTMNFKMNIILIIILILNFMLIFISKIIAIPMKPFRSTS